MKLFEYPYVIFSILFIFVVLLGGIGIYFAVRGLRTANDDDEEEENFTNLNKLENNFIKAGKKLESRCIMFISVSLESYRSLYSKKQTEQVNSDIKKVLFHSFMDENCTSIAPYGDSIYVVHTTLDMEKVRNLAEVFQSALGRCLHDNGAVNLAEVRIGAFFAFGSEVTFDEAIRRAKQACILAKGKNLPYDEWDVGSSKALETKIKIENNIESEIDNNRFFLEYQPVLDAKTKEIIGAEVLSRLNSEVNGILAPGSFLSAVDSVGLNNKFDYYIFEKNCKWISNDKNQREGYKYTINFSRSTLCEPAFAEKILEIANKYGLKSSCLAVEVLEDKNITEDARQRMTENLKTLKEKGISILLDDFGSGYTTFGDLQNLDISIVKIDRSLTRNSTTENGYIILENIIRTAKNIGFKTLCEGVETKEQEEAVIRAGCDLLQGFYYYKPMPVNMIEKLFRAEDEV